MCPAHFLQEFSQLHWVAPFMGFSHWLSAALACPLTVVSVLILVACSQRNQECDLILQVQGSQMSEQWRSGTAGVE